MKNEVTKPLVQESSGDRFLPLFHRHPIALAITDSKTQRPKPPTKILATKGALRNLLQQKNP
jgi:hypothetical protein